MTRARACLTGVIDVLDQIERFEATQELLDAANVIFCTLSTSGVAAMRRTKKINDLFVDEAAAATEPEVMIPFHLAPERMLAVGDPKQLPAVLMSRYAVECGLDKSLIGRLMYDCSHEYTMLDKQYRMRPEIRSLPSQIFYDGKILDGDNVSSPDYKGKVSILGGRSYSFLQVKGVEETMNHSYYNMKEAQTVLEMVVMICDAWKNISGDGTRWYAPEKVRIITFYAGQVSCIRRLLNKNGFGQVVVATVDSSQGCESDIVIISFVRSNENSGKTQQAGFLQDERRLNVALTRAKYQLICIGDANNTLSTSGVPALQTIVEDVKIRGLLSDYKPPRKSPPRKSHGRRDTSTKYAKKGYAKERRNWGKTDSSNVLSDYANPEQKSIRNNSSPSKTFMSANVKECTGLASSNIKSDFLKVGPDISAYGSAYAKEYTRYNNSNSPNVEPERKVMGSHNTPLNGSTFYNKSEPERTSVARHNTPLNVSTPISALAKEYTGYMKGPKKHQNSYKPSPTNNVVLQNDQYVKDHKKRTVTFAKEYTGYTKGTKKHKNSYKKPSPQNQVTFQHDQHAKYNEKRTVMNRTSSAEAEKQAAKKVALMEKIASLQKEVDALDQP